MQVIVKDAALQKFHAMHVRNVRIYIKNIC